MRELRPDYSLLVAGILMTSCAAAGSAARLALIQDGKPFMLVTGENTPSLSRTARSTSAATSRPMNMR